MTEKRPILLTIICVVGILGGLLGIPFIFTEAAKSIGLWYQIYASISIAAGFICFAGLWMMKKWGIIIYTMLTGINQIVLIKMNIWNIFAIIMPVIVIIIGFIYFKEME